MNDFPGQPNRRYRTLTPGFVEDSPPATAIVAALEQGESLVEVA
jgi:hypothetical protein